MLLPRARLRSCAAVDRSGMEDRCGMPGTGDGATAGWDLKSNAKQTHVISEHLTSRANMHRRSTQQLRSLAS